MYLVAIKSIFRRFGRGMVIIVDDGSIDASDRALLERHVVNVRFIAIEAIATSPCPQGGTWERLLTILDLSRDCYVIQVDADLVATGPMTEVIDAVVHNRAFTLSGGQGDDVLLTAAVASRNARAKRGEHIQSVSERVLDQCPELRTSFYVRGCSGFAGFPRNAVGRSRAVLFSTVMQGRFGARWREWGTEQVCSNFVIANFPVPLVLPWPKYMSVGPHDDPSAAELLHFYGTHRFHGGHYTRLSRRSIMSLADEAAKAAL